MFFLEHQGSQSDSSECSSGTYSKDTAAAAAWEV